MTHIKSESGRYYFKYTLLIFASLLAFCQADAYAQDSITSGSFYYPSVMNSGAFKSDIQLTLAKLPEDVVEEVSSLIYAPILSYHALLGMPYGFSLQGSVSSNYITYHFSAGPKWNYRSGRFSFAIGYDVALWFGEINDFDFASKVRGWMNYPNIAVGFAFNRFTLSVKGEATLITSFHQFAEDIEVKSDLNNLGGYSIGAYLEQPLWKDNYLALGFKANFSRFYYPAWAAFPTWDRFNFVPEIIVGFIL